MIWFEAALRMYGGAVSAVAWGVLAPRARLAIARGREPERYLAARLGRAPHPAAGLDPSPVLVHAVSLGELQAARALIDALARESPGLPVVLSCGTNDALAVASATVGAATNVRAVVALPWDRRAAMRAWVAQWRPRGVVLIEAELWPNLIAECARAGVPVVVASGRVTERDAARYAWGRAFFLRLLRGVAVACVQDEVQGERFARMGISADRVRVAGDLKVDAAPAPAIASLACTGAPLIVAGSLRVPEERLLTSAWRTVHDAHRTARLVVVPRHARRAAAVVTRFTRDGARVREFDAALRDGLGPGDVTVANRPGLLASLYASADVAVVGGSFSATGAHNVYEPARGGAAIVAGPSGGAVTGALVALDAARGLVRVDRAAPAELAAAISTLLADDEGRAACAGRAREWLVARGGAARRTAAVVLETIS